MMRIKPFLVIPYIILLGIIIVCFTVLQRDQLQIEQVAERDCTIQKNMYAIIARGLRNQASIERSLPPPPQKGDAQSLRSNALLLEAHEMDMGAKSLPNCANRPLQSHPQILPSPKKAQS
jgi:hypothetical protein